jgi:Outer membrane protein beta-barrel domain
MKNILLAFCILMCFSTIGLAQSKMRIGIEGGANYANYSASGFDSKVAFVAGVSSEFQIKNKIYITAELLFERKRAIKETTFHEFDPNDPFGGTGYVFREYIQNDYLVLPIQVKFEFSKYDPFYISTGFFAAYALNTDYHTDDDTSYYYDTGEFKNMDYGMVIGFGKSFNLGTKKRLNIEIRENIGMADINNISYQFSGSSVTTNSLNLLLDYSFDIK